MNAWLFRLVADPRFFPSVLVMLDIFAAARWACCPGEWRRAVYWLAAAILTASVTW